MCRRQAAAFHGRVHSHGLNPPEFWAASLSISDHVLATPYRSSPAKPLLQSATSITDYHHTIRYSGCRSGNVCSTTWLLAQNCSTESALLLPTSPTNCGQLRCRPPSFCHRTAMRLAHFPTISIAVVLELFFCNHDLPTLRRCSHWHAHGHDCAAIPKPQRLQL